MTWAIASVEDDKSGFSIVDMIGSFWSLELIALTLVLLVGAVAGAALRRAPRGVRCMRRRGRRRGMEPSVVADLRRGRRPRQELLRAGLRRKCRQRRTHLDGLS